MSNTESNAEQDWFSDQAIRARYRYWFMVESDSKKVGFVPYDNDKEIGWCALPSFVQWISLDEIKPFADAIWSVADFTRPRWKNMKLVYERFEGASKAIKGGNCELTPEEARVAELAEAASLVEAAGW